MVAGARFLTQRAGSALRGHTRCCRMPGCPAVTWLLLWCCCCCHRGYVRALDDAIKIIDEISVPIDTNDRQQVGCVGGWGVQGEQLGRQCSWARCAPVGSLTAGGCGSLPAFILT